MTILAVANGSFPLQVGGEEIQEDNYNSPAPGASASAATGAGGGAAKRPVKWGGSEGYWGMIEAVCDNEPPSAGPDLLLCALLRFHQISSS